MGSLTKEAHVLNAFLESVVGSHRVPTWSHGSARLLADSGVWDSLMRESALDFVAITNSNIHTSCAYDIAQAEVHDAFRLYLSTVIPVMTVFDPRARRAIPQDALNAHLRQAIDQFGVIGFRYLDDRICRTLSPYIDPEFEYPLVYFEMLFEWFEGEEMFGPAERFSPWR